MSWTGGRPVDKANLVALVTEFRAAAEADARTRNLPRLLLSMAVSAGGSNIAAGYVSSHLPASEAL